MERILLIEDDQALGRGTALALAGEGREIRVAATLAQGWAALSEGEYALVLLDLNLPDGNGLDFLTALRRTSGVPVLILTANDLERADDYVTKPFSLAVLRARVNRLLRRGSTPAATLELGPFSFDFERLRFMRNGTEVELSKTEQRLLRLLVEHRGQTLTREQLLDRVWDGGESRRCTAWATPGRKNGDPGGVRGPGPGGAGGGLRAGPVALHPAAAGPAGPDARRCGGRQLSGEPL